MAAELQDPEILAALGEMFTIDPAILNPRPPHRNPMVSMAIALIMPLPCLLLMLTIHFVRALSAGHFVADSTIQVSALLVFFALITAVGALILKD